MAATSPGRVRLAGVILLLCAAVLKGIGLYLVYLALSWTMPVWLPADLIVTPQGAPLPVAALRDTPLGLAAAYVVGFGGVAGLNGLWMLLLGRRNWLLVALLLVLFAVFVAVGLWAALEGDGLIRQMGG